MPRYADATQLAEIMKSEILKDMLDGVVPGRVSSFSELHNFVDANAYGSPEIDDPYLDFAIIDDAQCMVNEWLQSRSLRER